MMNSIDDRTLLALMAICFLLLMSVFFIIIIVGLFKKRQSEHRQEKITLQHQYQQEILQAQLEIQNQTLQQIGRELHDNIGQLLSVMSINLDILEEDVSDLKTRSQIIDTSKILQQTIADVRSLSKSLDGDFAKDFGLVDSLSHDLRRIRATGKYQTEILMEGEPYRLDGQKEFVLFRIVQEILTNILKHAEAKTIKVTLHYTPAQFSLTVQDDGKGFDNEAVLGRKMENAGAGLRNIQRRTEMVGGTYIIETARGQGTKIEIQLPIVL
ncbi:sensor histidine kinase [Runella sp.]|uniref:sensor histidine kinase n=1 Tax=Runella sp. TaxID=1960881 RepID=UPI00262DFB95|nr:sensor histidine kinase [Runella sp.]